MNFESLVEEFGAAEFNELCERVRAVSEAEYFGKPVEKGFDTGVPHDISDSVWESDLSERDKLNLIQRLYEVMPTYTFIFYISVNYESLPEEEVGHFWSWARSTLASGEPSLIYPLAYSLWCDFFEDSQRVERAWRELTGLGAETHVLRAVLKSSGPVPYGLKSILYERLIPDEEWHQYIFESLLFSSTDVFGKIDKSKARKVLRRLKLPRKTKHLKRLKSDLQSWWPLVILFAIVVFRWAT